MVLDDLSACTAQADLKRSLTFCFFEIASPPARNDPGELACDDPGELGRDDPGELGRDDEEGEDFFPFSDILFSFA